MRKYAVCLCYVFLLSLAAHTPNAYAHGGGLDGYGCHHNRKTGRYHCHKGQFAGRSFADQSEMLALLYTGSTVKPKQSAVAKATPTPALPTNPTRVAVQNAVALDAAFSPRDESLALILSSIEAARETVLVAAYSFTNRSIAEALRDISKRGVKVQVVADKKREGIA